MDDTKTDEDLTTGEVRFTTKAELLYRMLKTREGRIKSQLVFPKEMRENALRVAHEGIMIGHHYITLHSIKDFYTAL